MRRKGHRGNLPGKSIPIRSHPSRKYENEDIQSGVDRGPVNVDQVMAANFKPELYIEKFPHGYDPFEGDVTALQKKVVYRPTVAQIKSGSTKKEPRYVNISSGVNGKGMVQHEKAFAPKNARYVEVKTQPIMEGPVEHEIPILEKNSDPIEFQAGSVYDVTEDVNHEFEKTQKPYRLTQPQQKLTTNPQVEMEPGLDIDYHRDDAYVQNRRNNPDYGYVSVVSVIQTPIEQNVPYRSAKADRHQVQAEIWTGDRYEYVAVNEVNRPSRVDTRRQPTEDDYNQQAVSGFEDQYVEAYDDTTINLKDRRQQGDYERDQYAQYDYQQFNRDIDVNDGDENGRGEARQTLKNRKQQDGTQNNHYAGVGDHQDINVEDPHDRWDPAENRRGRRVQYAQAEVPFDQQYDVDLHERETMEEAEVHQDRKHQARPQHSWANHEVEGSSIHPPLEIETHQQRRRTNARPGTYDEQDQYRDGEAGYENYEFDGINPAELHVEQRRARQYNGRMASEPRVENGYNPTERSEAAISKKKTIPNHEVRTAADSGVQSGTRDKAVRSERVKHQEGSTYAERRIADPSHDTLDYAAKSEEKPAATRRQYSAKQASEVSIATPESEVRGSQEAANRNRRQISARADNERSIPEFDDPEGTRLVEKQQKGRGVDEFDVAKQSGIDNPYEENSGFDPVSLETTQAKKHLARQGTIETAVKAELHEAGSAKSGNDSNRRSRVPMISPNIEARAQRQVIYRRRKKIDPVAEVAAIEGN